jgi:hypothetical protein
MHSGHVSEAQTTETTITPDQPQVEASEETKDAETGI